jgi:hypothetical protein
VLSKYRSFWDPFFPRKRKSLAFRCIDRKRRFMYKSAEAEEHPRRTTQPKTSRLRELLAQPSSSSLRPRLSFCFDRVHEGSHRRALVIEGYRVPCGQPIEILIVSMCEIIIFDYIRAMSSVLSTHQAWPWLQPPQPGASHAFAQAPRRCRHRRLPPNPPNRPAGQDVR